MWKRCGCGCGWAATLASTSLISGPVHAPTIQARCAAKPEEILKRLLQACYMGCNGRPHALCYGYAEGKARRTNRFHSTMTNITTAPTTTYDIPLQVRLDSARRRQQETLQELETAKPSDWDAIYKEIGMVTALIYKLEQLMK